MIFKTIPYDCVSSVPSTTFDGTAFTPYKVLLLKVALGVQKKNLKYWLILSKIRGILPKDALKDIDNIEEVFERDKTLSIKLKERNEWIEQELELIEKHDVSILTINDALYPPLLKEIHDPPLLLYARGNFRSIEKNNIAVVGTRRASHYGLGMAEAISCELADAGFVIVSGMARGCDSYAHKGALKGGGNTVAVLGSGVDVVYPKENRILCEEIMKNGVLISEFPMSTPPFAYNFLRRNRIISGISLGVVVVEAPLKSGAMATARLALEQGRDVFALPGPARSEKNGGTNKLIKDGAVMAEGVEDILAEILPDYVPKRSKSTEDKTPLDGEKGTISRILDEGPVHIDAIAVKSGLSVERVSSILLDMELDSIVKQMPGKIFAKKPY